MKIFYAGHKHQNIITGGQRRIAMVFKYLSEANCKITYLETNDAPNPLIRRNSLLTNLWYIFQLIKNGDREIIILEDYSRRFYLFLLNCFVRIACTRKVKVVCLVNALYFNYRKSWWKNIVDKKVSILFFKPADLIIAGGKAAQKELVEMGILERKIRTIYPALRPEFIKKHQKDLGQCEKATVELLFVGRLNPVKGLEYLIDAMGLLRNWNLRLTIVGNTYFLPEYTRKIKDKIEELGIGDQIDFKGEISDPNDLLKLYETSDILVLPSVWDTSPITIIEAMCVGLPVVATAVGGIPDWVEDGTTGILVPPKDPEALSVALRELIQQPLLRQSMAQAAYNKSIPFRGRTWKNVGKDYHQALQDLAEPGTSDLVLMPNSYPPQVGGLEIALGNLSKHLVKKGHRVTVITGSPFLTFSKEVQPAGITVYRVPFVLPRLIARAGNKKLLISVAKSLVSPFLAPLALLKTLQILHSKKPASVNLHYIAENAFYCLAAKKLMNFKLIVNIHGSDIERYFKRSFLSQWLIKHTLKAADMVLSNSKYLLGKAAEICPEVQNKSGVVENGINIGDFETTAPPPEQKYLLSVGNLTFDKGFDILIRAFHQIHHSNPGLSLFIAGDGSELGQYISLAKQLGLNSSVKFLGRVKNSDIPSLLHGCECFIMPSRKEAFGIALLEAMAAEKAVVATRTDGIPELVEHMESGLLVEPDSNEEMARAIQLLLDDEKLRLRISERAHQVARQYGWDEVAEKYLQKYEIVSKC